jgi:NADH-quinone oxidoreductase subunit D
LFLASRESRQGSVLDFIEDFANRFPVLVDEYETLLTDNRIWKQLTVSIVVVTPQRALALGMTGPMILGSGIELDHSQFISYYLKVRLMKFMRI